MVKHEAKRETEMGGSAATPENTSTDIDDSLRNELEQVGAELGKRASD